MAISASPQFVFKISKYCNLRCDYCYEFPYLGDRARMSLAQVRSAFENIKRSISELSIKEVDFIWHGGEPFLIPLSFMSRSTSFRRKSLRANSSTTTQSRPISPF